MKSIHTLKSRMLWTGMWLAENPARMQIVILAVSALAVAATVLVGLSTTGVMLAGYSAGGSGGSG
jgi:hypothetical protein